MRRMRDLALLRVFALLVCSSALVACGDSLGGVTDGAGPSSSGTESTDAYDTFTSSSSAGPKWPTTGTTDGYCPCEWVDCGDAGECDGPVENPEREEAVCQCPDGLELGHACYSCTKSAGSGAAHPLNIDVRTIEGVVLVDDEEPPTDATDAGILSLRDAASGDRVELGLTTSGTWSARVATRLYDLYYAVKSSSGAVPENTDARVRRIAVDFFGSPVPPETPVAELFVNHLGGALSVGGVPVPQDAIDAGELSLRSVETGELISLGSTSEGSYEIGVLDGTYELIYEAVSQGGLMPVNSRGVVSQLEISSAIANPETFPLEIPTATLTINLTVNNMPPSPDATDYGLVYLRDMKNGALTLLGETTEGSYTRVVLPGAYELVYTNITSANGAVPVNKHARVGEAFQVGDIGDAPVTVDVDIPMVQVNGAFSVGGGPPPASAADDGVLTLESVDGQGTVTLGNTSAGAHSESIIPGSYDIYYAQETASQLMPQNTHAFIMTAPDLEGGTLDIDIPVITISGTLALSDGGDAISELEDGRVYLRNEDRGDSVLLGNLSKGDFTRRIVPGSFTAHYSIETGGELVPANGDARISEQALALTLDAGGIEFIVPVTDATVAVTYNGEAPPTDKVDFGAIFLEDVESGDEIYLGDTTQGVVSRRVVAGDYVIRYRHRAGDANSESPQNENVSLDCVQFVE